MMIVAIALCAVMSPAPAFSQASQQVLAWAEQLVAVQQQIVAATDAVSGVSSAFRSARSRDELLEASRTMSLRAAEARARLAAARRALDEIPPLTGDEAVTAFANSVLADTRNTVAELDALLAEAQGLEGALRANDANRVRQIAERIMSGTILIVRTQANVARARQAAFPPEESDHQIYGSLASFYSGIAAILTTHDAAAVANIRTAAEQMTRWNASARAVLAVQREGLSRLSGNARLSESRYLDLTDQQLDVLEAAAMLMRSAAESLSAPSTHNERMAFARPLAEAEQRLQAIMLEQAQLTLEAIR